MSFKSCIGSYEALVATGALTPPAAAPVAAIAWGRVLWLIAYLLELIAVAWHVLSCANAAQSRASQSPKLCMRCRLQRGLARQIWQLASCSLGCSSGDGVSSWYRRRTARPVSCKQAAARGAAARSASALSRYTRPPQSTSPCHPALAARCQGSSDGCCRLSCLFSGTGLPPLEGKQCSLEFGLSCPCDQQP